MASPECQFFVSNSLTDSLYAKSTGFALTFSKTSTLTMKLVSFLPTGNYVGEKTFVLPDLMKCGTPGDAGAQVTIGTNIKVECTYNVNSLIAMMSGKQWKGRVY